MCDALARRWRNLWERWGGGPGADAIFAALVQAYAELHRAYHTLDHVLDCLAQLDRARGCAEQPDEIEMALWFHDAVYAPGAADNEEKSAHWARQVLGTSNQAARIVELILATRHTQLPATPDACLIADIDLAILGASPDKFDDYERKIRREYSNVPEALYRPARAEILQAFLSREAIYLTPFFRELEAQARVNLRRLLELLRG